MNFYKCAGYSVNLLRFSRGILGSNRDNLKVPRRLIILTAHNGSNNLSPVLDERSVAQINIDNISETETVDLLQNLSNNNNYIEDNTKALNDVWKQVTTTQNNKLSANFYNTYLEACIENDIKIDHKTILKFAKENVDTDTYHLLMKGACYNGDTESIVKILNLMKDVGVPADEEVFNLIVLGHIVKSGLDGGRTVLLTMKSIKIPVTNNTHWSIIKGLSKRKDKDEFITTLADMPKLPFNETLFYDMLFTLGLNDNHLWFQDFLNFIGKESISRQELKSLDSVCFQLIRRNKPEASYALYKALQETTVDASYGMELIEEMLMCKIPIETIITICKDLMTNSLNDNAMLNTTELALRHQLVEESYKLFSELKSLRPHYFWPLFATLGIESGEKGVFEVLGRMDEFGVKADYDTITNHLLKYCDTSDIESLLLRLKQYQNFTMKELMTPIMYILLSGDKIVQAENLCTKYDTPFEGEPLIKELSLVWKNTQKSDSVAFVLQKICETNSMETDWTGKFLLKSLKLCKLPADYEEMLKLINILKIKELKMSSVMADELYHVLKTKCHNCTNKEEIETAFDKLLDISKPEPVHIKHPRDMNLEELECHLIELTSKNMETRGALRLLIQGYSGINNFTRAEELRRMFEEKNYTESAGMKASLLNSYIQAENIEGAENMFNDLKQAYPNFIIDSFKIVDYVALLMANDKFDKALNILTNEKTIIRNTYSIEKNCWRLLNAVKSPEQGQIIFKALIDGKYCQPTNTILGPLVRAYLKIDDLNGAVNTYCEFVRRYKCTPLQLEMISALIKSKEEKLLSKTLDSSAKIHGVRATKQTFLSALAENGLTKPLFKLLTDSPSIDNNELKKRCERWVTEDKILPLQTFLSAANRLSSNFLDLSIVRLSIVKIYASRNDCESAIQFWKQCEQKDSAVFPALTDEVMKLLNRCKYEVPDVLKSYSS